MIGDLFAHMEWADARVWRAVVEADAFSDQTLREKLHHIHLTQRAFYVVWTGGVLELPWKPFDTAAETIAWARGNYAELLPYAANATELERVIEFPWAARLVEAFGTPAPVTLRDTFVQLPSHSTYHRGQVNMRLRELGSEPPLVDYIAWLWLGRPTPEWPAIG
jgi:uncharacterized damage-inducible protein DinB